MAYLALDLGAGSGRAIVGTLENGRIQLDEVHRFSNNPVKLGDTLYWDFLSLFANIKKGIQLAIKKGYDIKGIAVDTWGVDFGLLDKNGRLLSNPVCYRDMRTVGMAKNVSSILSKEEMYRMTGIQQMEINTVFQLVSMNLAERHLLDNAETLLFTPDLINYFLTGRIGNEYTIASTSQLLNAETREYEQAIFEKLDIPARLFPRIVKCGECIGELRAEIQEETGAGNIPVFAVGAHDTASAIAAIPAEGDHWAFLSSGTWSLLGVETDEPVLTTEAMQHDFTNEGGADNKILFMRNITGLWLLQRLIADWEKEDGEKCSYEIILGDCNKAECFKSFVDSDDPVFTHPVSMVKAIQEYCIRTHQPVPETRGELVRCVLESLAMKYYFVMKKLTECTGKNIEKLYIVGGGSKNASLNRFIATALNLEVVTGLEEGTAVGNIMLQAVAAGELSGMHEAKEIIRNSFEMKSYLPENHAEWAIRAEEVRHLFNS